VILEQNLSAVYGDLTLEQQKNGDLQANASGYIAKEKELKELNNELYNQVNDQKGKVITLSNTIVQLMQNQQILEQYLDELNSKFGAIVRIDDSTYTIPWKLTYRYDSTNFDMFTGNTTVMITSDTTYKFNFTNLGSKLITRKTQIGLTFGQKVINKQLQVYVQSAYPGFTATSLNGVLIDPNTNPYIRSLIKKKHWFTGFSLGPAAIIGINQTGIPFFAVGVGVTYNIYSF